ncbi:MAG: phosphohydrolase [Phycisphaeraceae bacterium]|nr:phosphohydrolase [Phycisphaeraceae bacterium]
MDWIQTYTGRQFFPLNPRAGDIDIADIAHALSLQCRFNGHCRCFYSVAEHSVRVSQVAPAKHALWGLLHDAAEAYLTDLPRPVKSQLPWFSEQEDKLLDVLMRHFGLTMPPEGMPTEVKMADDTLLATEARDLMATPPAPWKLNATPLPDRIEPWTAEVAEQRFLERFAQLRKR